MKIIYQATDGYTISADPTTGRALLVADAKAAEVYMIAPAAILRAFFHQETRNRGNRSSLDLFEHSQDAGSPPLH